MVSFTWHTACLLSLVAVCDKAATCTDTCAASCVVVLHLPASSSPSATTTVPSAWHVTDQEKPRVVSARINGTAEWTRTAMRGAWRVRSVHCGVRAEAREPTLSGPALPECRKQNSALESAAVQC